MPKFELPKIEIPKIEIPTIDIKSIDLPEVPEAAQKPIYAGVGATDLAVEKVKGYVADVRSGAFPSDAESFSVAVNKATPTNIEAPCSTVGKK